MFDFGFIGAGNMGGALAKAVCSSIDSKRVAVSCKSLENAEEKAKELNCKAVNNETIAKESKFIFLGVKPQILPDLLKVISPALKSRKDEFILVTMAAGITIETIEELCEMHCPIIRIMPNTPVSVGSGIILYCYNDMVTDKQKKKFLNALKTSGEIDEISEDLIDAGSCISGCGPAFVYMFINAIAKAGESVGLDPQQSLKYAVKTVLGSAKLAEISGEYPDKLKNDVCSPAGSTIEGVYVLENENLYKTVENAVNASYKRTKELGKK